ncbi:hypothetical protein [Pseudohongiella acticola]|uniref:hypothetical protein n=1 Tax=Pseudohongiella acticola TaxID=1524254 RepID=UPI0011131E5D|nr:hypothetical protein [Pseudohongiella acticola]
MKVPLKHLAKPALFVSFVCLTIIPAFLISDRYGISYSSEVETITASVSTECENVDNLEFFVTTEEGFDDSRVQVAINLKDGNSYISHDCEKVVIALGKNSPSRVVLTDYFSEEILLDNVIKEDGDENYSLTLNYEETPILAGIVFSYDDSIDRSGIANYAIRGRFRISDHNVTPEVSEVQSKVFFSLPYIFSPNGHFPQSTSQTVDSNFDHIKYNFPSDTETIIVKWTDQDRQDRSVLEMLLLSALFGVGISGLIEFALSRLKAKI